MKRKIRKTILLLFVMMIAMTMFGCNQKPSEVLGSKIESIKTEGNNAIIPLLQEDESEENIDCSSQFLEALNAVINQVEYKINSEKINKDTATVNITVKGADCSEAMDKFLKEYKKRMDSKIQNGETLKQDEIAKENDESMSDIVIESETKERTMDIELIKEDDEWKIKDDKQLLKLLINIDIDEDVIIEKTHEED